MTYYKVSTKTAENKELGIPEAQYYLYTGGGYDTESEATHAALLFLSTGKFASTRVVRFETKVIQTFNKDEVEA